MSIYFISSVEISRNDIVRGRRYNILRDGTLRIDQTQDSDQGSYECVAENDMGTVTTQAAHLTYHGDLGTHLYSISVSKFSKWAKA